MASIVPSVELGGFMAIMALLWTRRRNMAGLRERMARRPLTSSTMFSAKGMLDFHSDLQVDLLSGFETYDPMSGGHSCFPGPYCGIDW